jgi:hypothetical protein
MINREFQSFKLTHKFIRLKPIRFRYRFVPAYVKLREELAAKAAGDIYSVNVNFGVVITSDRVFKKELGGGSVLDIGVYAIQVLFLSVSLNGWARNFKTYKIQSLLNPTPCNHKLDYLFRT